MLTSFGLLSIVASLVPPAHAGDDLLYRRTWTFGAEGRVEAEVEGSPVYTAQDGTTFVVGPGRLEAPDGARFGIDYDAQQLSADGPLVTTMEVRRSEVTTLSMEERVEHWREAHPEATAAAADAYVERVLAGSMVQHERTIDPAFLDMLAGAEDVVDVSIMLAGDPGLNIPSVGVDLADTDPVAVLDQMEERVLAIEDRKTEIAQLEADFLAEAEAGGARIYDTSWLYPGIRMSAPVDLVEAFLDDPRIDRIEQIPQYEGDSNDGAEMRIATQVEQFLDATYDGETPSGHSSNSDMFGVVIDGCIDEDHPAFNDSSLGSSRLKHVWRKTSGVWGALGSGVHSCTSSSLQHGQPVAAIFAGDLEDLQDSYWTTPSERERSSGTTLESSFDFIEDSSPQSTTAWDQAGTLYPDVVNRSQSCKPPTCSYCDLDSTANNAVDSLYLLGAFIVNTPGNEFHDPANGCSVAVPGAAAASFTAGNYAITGGGDPNSAALASTSSRGGDTHDRALIDLIAAGRETSALPKWDNSYQMSDPFTGASGAAPTISGAVANLKDFLLTIWSSAFTNDVGNLYAAMLIMGDGETEDGTLSVAEAPDDAWGVGRMRMRMFNTEGMDYPWRARACSRVLADGELDVCSVNPNGSGVNQSLDSDVDRFKSTIWWYEPNVGSSEIPADIEFRLWKDGTSYAYNANYPVGAQRLTVNSGVGGHLWSLTIYGDSIPISTNTSYYSGLQKREVHVALYWEDEDRDDSDGPSSSID